MAHAHNFIDLTGSIFGRLKVLNIDEHKSADNRVRWICECSCGNIKSIRTKDLRNGNSRSCGCAPKRKFTDMTGFVFGRLTVVSLHSKVGNEAKWNCVCVCGNTSVVFGNNLRRNHTTSCGCQQKEATSKAKMTHGWYAKNERLAGIWYGMVNRCHNEADSNYYKYGARGIIVCDEWRYDTDAFCEWAISNGYSETLAIDRKNNDGNYEPTNCRWVTTQVNSQNTRRTLGEDKVREIRKLSADGIKNKVLMEMFGVSKSTIINIKYKRSYNNIL